LFVTKSSGMGAGVICSARYRQHTPAYVSIRQHTPASRVGWAQASSAAADIVSIRQHTYSLYSQHTSAYVQRRAGWAQASSAAADIVSIRQHTSAYVSIRQIYQFEAHYMYVCMYVYLHT
jgi:hypothetical protein